MILRRHVVKTKNANFSMMFNLKTRLLFFAKLQSQNPLRLRGLLFTWNVRQLSNNTSTLIYFHGIRCFIYCGNVSTFYLMMQLFSNTRWRRYYRRSTNAEALLFSFWIQRYTAQFVHDNRFSGNSVVCYNRFFFWLWMGILRLCIW